MKKQGIPSAQQPKMAPQPQIPQMIPIGIMVANINASIAAVLLKAGLTEITLTRDDFLQMEGRYKITRRPGIEQDSFVVAVEELPKAEATYVPSSKLAIPGRDF